MPELVPLEVAARSTGITSRTLRYWVSSGKLPVTTGKRGRLVSIDDVRRIAALTGRVNEKPKASDISPGNPSGLVAGSGTSISAIAPEALTTLRDEWLMPLVRENGDLQRQIGRLEAELRIERDLHAATLATLAKSEGSHEPHEHEAEQLQTEAQRGIPRTLGARFRRWLGK